MNPINHNPPDNSRYFIFVSPAPTDKSQDELLNDAHRTFRINGQVITASLIDLLIYPFSNMSDFHCRWAYGLTNKEMQKYLLSRWKTLQPGTKIAFYLFEKES